VNERRRPRFPIPEMASTMAANLPGRLETGKHSTRNKDLFINITNKSVKVSTIQLMLSKSDASAVPGLFLNLQALQREGHNTIDHQKGYTCRCPLRLLTDRILRLIQNVLSTSLVILAKAECAVFMTKMET
jgi:hypothetical protein